MNGISRTYSVLIVDTTRRITGNTGIAANTEINLSDFILQIADLLSASWFIGSAENSPAVSAADAYLNVPPGTAAIAVMCTTDCAAFYNAHCVTFLRLTISCLFCTAEPCIIL